MRGYRWVAALSVLGVAACAPGPATKAADQAAAPAETTKADCTKATKVQIIEKDGRYAFSPAGLTIQRGAFLAVTDKADAVHPLKSEPDAGIVKSVVDRDERQIIQFPKAGEFTVTTGGAQLHLTVKGESGCDTVEPSLTIEDGGEFSPATATVVATANFAVVNRSGKAQKVSCAPGGGDHTRLDAGETEILAIDEPGTYECTGSDGKVTVTVTAA